MKRITVDLPNDMAAALAQEARRRGEPVSAVVCRALRESLRNAAVSGNKLPFVALGCSGRKHTARDAEKILGDEWTHGRRR